MHERTFFFPRNMSWRASNSNKANTNPFEVLQEEEQSPSPQRQHYRSERGQYAERQRLQTTATTHNKPEQSNMIADDGSKPRSRYREWTPTNGGDDEDVYAQSRLADNDGERQVDDLKGNIRSVKQDTLSSTRNALSTITDAQGIATTTLSDLGEQACT